MRLWAKNLLTSFAATGTLFAFLAVAGAETCTLETKRLTTESQSRFDPSEYIYRSFYPQSLFTPIQTGSLNQVRAPGMEQQTAAFKKIVKNEPKYVSEHPFRGVFKLGTQEYAFALDDSTAEAEAKKEKAKEEEESKSKSEEAKKDEKKTESGSVINKLKDALVESLSPAEEEKINKPPKPFSYDRLYFDINHNGDLTDDKVVEAATMPGVVFASSYRQFQFPRVDLTIDVDGTPVDYAFFISGYANASRDFSYVQVQLYSAAYREGDITLDGKKRRVVLVDFNSNGKFNDKVKIVSQKVYESTGSGVIAQERIYPEQGDMLLVDPSVSTATYSSPYELASNSYQNNVSKWISIEGKYYDMEISAAGDKLTLTPSSAPLGNITNPNGRFNAVLYGDDGIIKVTGNKNTPIPVPAGQWKLYSYMIDFSESPEPAKEEEKSEESKKTSGISALGKALESLLGSAAAPVRAGPRYTLAMANATPKYEPVKVKEGETVELPFGQPYKPVVTAQVMQMMVNGKMEKQTRLSMTLVGSAGETCSNMMVNGGRPSKPEFTITDPDGKVVESGSFEYG